MTPAEKKAREAVVRAAKQWEHEMFLHEWFGQFPEERHLIRAVCVLNREESKTVAASKRKGVRRGK